jgi:hypothetical protein
MDGVREDAAGVVFMRFSTGETTVVFSADAPEPAGEGRPCDADAGARIAPSSAGRA